MLNIFDAINKKNIDEINNILKKDSKSFFKKNTVLKSKNKQDNCPLYCAIEKGDLEVVDTIVKYSRDPHYLNCIKYSSLFVSTYFNNLELVKYFINKGAVIDKKFIVQLDKKNKNKNRDLILSTSLWIAIWNGYIDIAKYLLSKNANIKVKCDGLSLIQWASLKNNLNVLNFCLDNGSNINCRSIINQTPLHLAVICNNKNVVKLLITNGANIDMVDNIGYTPLHYAVIIGNLELVKYLVEAGSLITTYTYAVDLSKMKSIKNNMSNYEFLQGLYNNVNFRSTKKNYNSFSLAFEYGHIDIAKFFLNYDKPIDNKFNKQDVC